MFYSSVVVKLILIDELGLKTKFIFNKIPQIPNTDGQRHNCNGTKYTNNNTSSKKMIRFPKNES